MKKYVVLSLMVFALLWQCGKQQQGVALQKGTPEYDLAQNLSEKVPYLDPEKNVVLVSSDNFNVTTGEVVKMFSTNLGNRTDQLTNLDSTQIVGYVEQSAQQLGEQKLLLDEADKAGVSVSDTELDSIMNIQYQQVGGEDQFKQRIEQMGVTLDFVKEQIRKQLKIQKFLDQHLADQLAVSEDEIEDAYAQDKTYSVRHILLNTQGKTEAQKDSIYKVMQSILKRAKNGEDFAKLAKEYSEDPGSKNNGGLYEDIKKGTMVKPFEDAALNTPVGQISDIIETRYGYHILLVVDRKSETKPLDEVRDSLRTQLEQQKKNDVYTTYINDLKEKAHFEVKQL